MKKKTKKRILTFVIPAFVIILSLIITLNTMFDNGSKSNTAVKAAAIGANATTLSMVEMNNSFDKMVLRATMNKTLVYVDKLYFDYSPLNINRLHVTQNDETDYVVIDIKNSSGEWAKTWGYVRQENRVRPGDPLMQEMELTYLEINQYWEWRNFNNQENWSVTVNDGYNTVEFSFDINTGNDGAIYFIDGVYALPEHYYPQVVYWWDMTGDNPELLEIRDAYKQQAVEKTETTPDNEPIQFDGLEYRKSNNAAAQTGSSTSDSKVERTVFWIPMLVVALVVVSVSALVTSCTAKPTYVPEQTPSNITDPNDPNQRNENTPPAPTEDQQNEYNEIVPELSTEEKEELEKHKEFSLDNDVPTGQKIVKLKVKDADGFLQDVYDENGEQVYVNRKTYTVGNQSYALINRENLLLIRWFPSTMELKDIVGNRFTVNVDNKIMNMDGVEPYSPISQDDILGKLSDMGIYTSSINSNRMLFRIDDDQVLIKAMNLKVNNINKSFFGTIENAFKNIFGGGGGSKGFLSNFLDILILIGVFVIGVVLATFVFKFLRAFAFKE